MSIPSEFPPEYANIIGSVNSVAYGFLKHSVSWDILQHFAVEDLKKDHQYTMRDGKVYVGALESIQSCKSAPRVMVCIKTASDASEVLEGTLFGSKNKLGVSLDDVIEIK